MKKLCLIAAVVFAVSSVHAQFMEIPFPNADFEAGVVNAGETGFNGFENPATNIPGWFDYPSHPLNDSGVEGSGAWWGTYNGGFSAFMSPGDGAYNISEYTIQAGEQYTVSFVGKTWTAEGTSELTVSLFYDDPDNVFDTFSISVNDTWTEYSSPSFLAATSESVGGTIGVRLVNTGALFTNFDNVSVAVIPEPSTLSMIVVLCGVGLLVRRRMMRAS